MTNDTQEIDLLELSAKIGTAIKNNFLALITALIVGSGLGFAYFQFQSKVYESELIITSSILTESYSKSVFANLQKLIKENNIPTLSSLLHLSPNKASAINSIELKGTIEKGDGLQETDKTHINITVKSVDNTIWPSLQIGITTFIENNDFVKIRVAQQKKYFTSLISKLDHELNDLEILKSKIMDGKLSHSEDGMLILDPTTINYKIIDLNKEKLTSQNSLELVNSVQILQGFTTFEKSVSPKLSISVLVGALLGIFFVFAFIGIRSLNVLLEAKENN